MCKAVVRGARLCLLTLIWSVRDPKASEHHFGHCMDDNLMLSKQILLKAPASEFSQILIDDHAIVTIAKKKSQHEKSNDRNLGKDVIVSKFHEDTGDVEY